MAKTTFLLRVNGRDETVTARGETPLIYLLRNDLGLKGTRFGCGGGDCAACLVMIGGRPEKSCQTPIESVEQKSVETVEGLIDGDTLSVLQRAMLDEQAGQCGYCLSGILIAATALLRANPLPSEQDVREALDANLCRCGSHARIIAAVLRAARVPA